MRKLLLSFLLTAGFYTAFTQSVVKGKVADTLDKKPLNNAVVSLLKTSDSTLFKFTRTGKDGEFLIPNVAAGKYLVLVTYPKFVDYTDAIEVNGSETNLGSIPLTLQSHLLDEVVIRQNIAIRIKGDTIEYKGVILRLWGLDAPEKAQPGGKASPAEWPTLPAEALD